MPHNQTNAHFQHPNHAAYRSQLREAIRSRKVGKKEMKVGKPVDLQLTSECECAICLDTLAATNISVTPCGHKFCFTCLAENMRRSQNCPMCRTPLAKPAQGKKMDDEKFIDIQFEEADLAYASLRRITRGLNHIFQEHSFLCGRPGGGMNRHMVTIDPDNWDEGTTRLRAAQGLPPMVYPWSVQTETRELPEHLQALANYADEEHHQEEHQDEEIYEEDQESMYEFNQAIRDHPTVGGLRLPNDDDRSSAPSPESVEDTDSDSVSEFDEEEDMIDEVIDDMETDDGKRMWSYEKAILRLILEARAEGMASVCDWYENTGMTE